MTRKNVYLCCVNDLNERTRLKNELLCLIVEMRRWGLNDMRSCFPRDLDLVSTNDLRQLVELARDLAYGPCVDEDDEDFWERGENPDSDRRDH